MSLMSDIESIKSTITRLLDDAYEQRVKDLPSSIVLTEKALALSRQYNLDILTANSLSKLALFKMILGENEKSLELSQEAITIFKDLEDERGVAGVQYTIAGIYYKTNNFHLGMVYLLDCLIIFKKFEDFHNESRTQKTLGTIYEIFGDETNARSCYEAAVSAAIKGENKNLESNAYNPLSGLLLKQGEVEKALELIERAIAFKKETGDIRGSAFSIYGRGKVYAHQKQYKKAEADYAMALKIHNEQGEQFGKCMTYNKIALLRLELGERDIAVELLKKSIQLSKKYGIALIDIKSNNFLYKIYREDNNIEEALKYLEKYLEVKDKTIDSQTLKVIENYEISAVIKSSEREVRLELEKAEIEAKKDRAEQTAIVKQDFLSAMSHEIRTPLNAITSIISLLEERSVEDDKKLLESLRFSSANLLQIIDNILDFTKLDSNKMQLELHAVLFRNLIGNIRQTYQGMIQEKGLKLKVAIAKELSQSYKVDETKLFQILGNLLSNAIKYTEKGLVTLEVDLVESIQQYDVVRFKVRDTGVGIPETEIPKLFESFYMPRSITTRNYGGTGLGLAIVKKLVGLHDSTVQVESIEGEGSVFSFNLRLERSKAPLKSEAKLYKRLQDKTAILAEDNEINAMVMRRLLEKWGLRIERVRNGIEAVEKAKEKKVDFILMDIHMPKMNGFEATKIIRTEDNPNQDTHIFALTADITAVNDEEYESYFDGFLRKPMQIERLFETLLRSYEVTSHGVPPNL